MPGSEQTTQPPGVGRVLAGRYRLVAPIARGGMAEVWEGYDEVLSRPIAVKVLQAHLAADGVFLERFRREAVTAARLAHPGIVATFDTGFDQGTAFIVMELVRGRNLRQWLDSYGRLEPWQSVAVARQIADALSYAHQAGLVHRDVKPANILLIEDEWGGLRVKVTDFGIAKAGLDSTSDLTKTGMVLGTPKYLSPEQIRGRDPDSRADLYSLGVVLYEMLVGAPPYIGDTDMATALAHLGDKVPKPSARVRGIPNGLDRVVVDLLAKSPDRRIPTAVEVRRRLDGLGPLAPPSGRNGAPPRRGGRRRADDSHSPVNGVVRPTPRPAAPQPISQQTAAQQTAAHQLSAQQLSPPPPAAGQPASSPAGPIPGSTSYPAAAAAPSDVNGGATAALPTVRLGPAAPAPGTPSGPSTSADLGGRPLAPGFPPVASGTPSSLPEGGPAWRTGPPPPPPGGRTIPPEAAPTTAIAGPSAAAPTTVFHTGATGPVTDQYAVHGDVPSARRFRRAERNAGLVVLALVVIGAVVAVSLLLTGGRHHSPRSSGAPGADTSGGSPSIAAVQVYLDVTGHSLDNPQDADLTFDGNPATEWSTDQYHSPTFGNLYPGEGLVIQLKASARLGSLEVTSTTQGWAASTYVSTTSQPNYQNVSEWGPATDSQSDIPGDATFSLGGRTGQYVLLWITNLGPADQANVGELTVTG